MLSPSDPLIQLIRRDPRFRLEAYLFVGEEALGYAQDVMKLGSKRPSQPIEGETPQERKAGRRGEQHLTGQELCLAVRELAREQFGFMAKCVLNSWGIYSTGDIGEIVYNLIEIRHMRKTKEDRREDFDDVYDFDEAFCGSFEITLPE